MAVFEVHVDVMHKDGILDPAGATVQRALPALGWQNVSNVSIGKTIRLTIDADSESAAQTQLDAMCQQLLANPVIEDYEIRLTPGVAS